MSSIQQNIVMKHLKTNSWDLESNKAIPAMALTNSLMEICTPETMLTSLSSILLNHERLDRNGVMAMIKKSVEGKTFTYNGNPCLDLKNWLALFISSLVL